MADTEYTPKEKEIIEKFIYILRNSDSSKSAALENSISTAWLNLFNQKEDEENEDIIKFERLT